MIQYGVLRINQAYTLINFDFSDLGSHCNATCAVNRDTVSPALNNLCKYEPRIYDVHYGIVHHAQVVIHPTSLFIITLYIVPVSDLYPRHIIHFISSLLPVDKSRYLPNPSLNALFSRQHKTKS